MSTKTLTAPPAPKGDPALLRAYAASLRELAVSLRGMAEAAAAPLPRTWQGAAPVAAAATGGRLAAEFRTAAGAVEDMAGHLDGYAAKLTAASAHHHSWLKRAAEIGGVILVTAAVVTITVATVGAAAPVAAGIAIDAEAGAAAGAAAGVGAGAGAGAAASAGVGAGAAGATAETGAATAVAGMESAAASAASAETSLVGSLGARALPTLRGLAEFVRPQLVGAEVSTGFDATVHVSETGKVSPYSVTVDLAENIGVGGGVGAVAGRWLVRPGLLSKLGRVINPAAAGEDARPALIRHLSNAATNTAVDVVTDTLTGTHDSWSDIELDFVQGLSGSGVGDLAAAHDVKVARTVNAVRNLKLPALRLDDAGRVVGGRAGTVYRVDPEAIRFSQNSVSKTNLRVTALSAGWNGAPIDVVRMPDGSLTSLDNRRVLAARRAGVSANARLLDPEGLVPAQLLETRFARYRLKPGATWLDVVQARVADQRAWRGAHPYGRLDLPDTVTPGPVSIIGIRPPRPVRHAS